MEDLPLEFQMEVEKHRRLAEGASQEQLCELYIGLLTLHLRLKQSIRLMLKQGNF